MLDEFVRLQELGEFIQSIAGYRKWWLEGYGYLSHKNLAIDIPIHPMFSFGCGHLFIHPYDEYGSFDYRLNASLIVSKLFNRHTVMNQKYLVSLVILSDEIMVKWAMS